MLFTAIVTGLLLAGAPHSVEAGEAAPTEIVTHSDLDLATAAGQARLDRRVRGAAFELCATGALDLSAKMDEARCVRRVVAQAEAQVRAAVASAGGVRNPARFAAAPGAARL